MLCRKDGKCKSQINLAELLWKVKFREKGDFEGVEEMAKGKIYALKSDAMFLRFQTGKVKHAIQLVPNMLAAKNSQCA